LEDLSLHILDIVENSIRAAAKTIIIELIEDTKNDVLILEIDDDGHGMTGEQLEKAFNPFYSTKKVRRIGLGIPLLKQAARESNGDIDIHSEPGRGTHLEATFQHSHIDRKPIGDMLATLQTLIISHPSITFTYIHTVDGEQIINFKTEPE
jgi:signal transduction histidine kinase